MAYERFTHLAKAYGIKCYYNESTEEIKGTNFFNDFLINVFIWIDIFLLDLSQDFKIKKIKRL